MNCFVYEMREQRENKRGHFLKKKKTILFRKNIDNILWINV